MVAVPPPACQLHEWGPDFQFFQSDFFDSYSEAFCQKEPRYSPERSPISYFAFQIMKLN